MKTKALYLTVALGMMLGFSGCNMDFVPSDELNSESLLQSAKGAETVMNGCYALLKDEVEFLGYASGNTYIRHYTQMSEFPADNICLSAHTTDPLYEATAYQMNDGLKNVGTLWMVAYRVGQWCAPRDRCYLPGTHSSACNGGCRYYRKHILKTPPHL